MLFSFHLCMCYSMCYKKVVTGSASSVHPPVPITGKADKNEKAKKPTDNSQWTYKNTVILLNVYPRNCSSAVDYSSRSSILQRTCNYEYSSTRLYFVGESPALYNLYSCALYTLVVLLEYLTVTPYVAIVFIVWW